MDRHSDQPTYDVAEAIGNALIGAFLNDEPEARTIEEDGGDRDLPPGVDEVHVVFTQFRSMLTGTAGHPVVAARGRRR